MIWHEEYPVGSKWVDRDGDSIEILGYESRDDSVSFRFRETGISCFTNSGDYRKYLTPYVKYKICKEKIAPVFIGTAIGSLFQLIMALLGSI